MEHNPSCKSEGHDKHLCSLMYDGFHYSHREEYKAMVRDAEFLCQNCGRTAKGANSLCEPLKL